MRIVSWNCCWQEEGFTKKKSEEILKLNPDILIVQECKQEDWLKLNYTSEKGHWYGDGKESQDDPNKNLGIGIFCNEKYTIDCSLFSEKDLSNMRYAIPYIIKKENKEILTIFSVWARSGYKNYHVPIFNSLEYFYQKTNSSVAVIGDFKTGSQYGNKENESFYKDLKSEFEKKYHLENCAFWQEWLPTFHNKKKDRNYDFFLDDHCFFELKRKVVSFGMGNWPHWFEYSDHIPIITDIDDIFLKTKELYQGVHSMIKDPQWQQQRKELREEYEEFTGHSAIPTLKYGNYTKEFN